MEVLISAERLQERIAELAKVIAADFREQPTTIVGVLTGCIMFLADLVRHLDLALRIDLIQASSYRGPVTRPGALHISPELVPDVKGRHVPLGFGLMYVAGVLSGLLGIGSGALKVLAMDQAMRVPFKVSTTTSNFMIGVTAAASAGIYLARGEIDPGLAMPVMLGVLMGSTLGARVLPRARTPVLRVVFGVVIIVLAVEMIYKGLSGGKL